MYVMNGIELSGLELRTLREYSQRESCEQLTVFHEDPQFDTIKALVEKGLLDGMIGWGIVSVLGITQAGEDFVRDCESAKKDAVSDLRKSRIHDLVCAMAGALSGAVATLLIEHCAIPAIIQTAAGL